MNYRERLALHISRSHAMALTSYPYGFRKVIRKK